MPEEFSRTTARKRITLPGGATVDVPVITKISFIDPNDRYQETQFTIDNSAQSDRSVRVDDVASADNMSSIAVERILQWKTLDTVDRGQESYIEVDNTTISETPPPYFITHQKTHIVKYKSGPDTWIESELIDEISFLDPNDRYQETLYVLNNPETDDDAQADPNDPEISDADNGIDPPWRTDPWQNLVRFSEQSGGFSLFLFAWFREYPSGGDNFPNFDATISMSGWSVGDTWSGLPVPSGQGTAVLFTGNVGDYPPQSEDTIFWEYTEGSAIPGYPGWNNTLIFTITWAVRLGTTTDRTVVAEETYNLAGATFVHDSLTYECIGSAPANMTFFNKWTYEAPFGIPGLSLLFVQVTA